MEKQYNNMMRKTVLLLVLTIYLCSFISGVGINGPYIEDRTVYVMPGESVDLQFFIQNGGSSPEESSANSVIVGGNEFFRIIDEKTDYYLPIGAKQAVNTRVEIPQGTPIGTTKEAIIRFNIEPVSGSGVITFGSSIDQTFKIYVGERPKPQLAPVPEKPNYLLFLILLIIIILVILIILMYFSRKKKDKNKEVNKIKKVVKAKK